MTEEVVGKLQEQLETLTRDMTTKQVEFLRYRQTTKTDIEAVSLVPVSLQALTKWKKQSAFQEAYQIVVGKLKSPDTNLIVAPEQRQSIMIAQIATLTRYLPDVVKENIRIALYGQKEADRLKAIQMVYDAVGLKTETVMPVSKQNAVFVQMMQLVQPQTQAEATKRGIPVDADYIIEKDTEEDLDES